MTSKKMKRIDVTILNQNYIRNDWYFDFDSKTFQLYLEKTSKEFKKLGILLAFVRNRDVAITINSYADLLNVIKISSEEDGHNNQCVGHIIGKSPNLDILEDLISALRRIAFAPETVPPSNEFRKVCHNCGCGC